LGRVNAHNHKLTQPVTRAEHVDPPPLPVVAMLIGEDMQMYDVVDDQPSSMEVVGQILMAQAMDVHAWLPGATLLVHLAPVQ